MLNLSPNSSEDHIRDKAAKWAGHLLFLQGAEEEFKPHFVVSAPRDPRLRDAYVRALAALRHQQKGAEVVEASEAESLVDRIEAEMCASDAAPVA